MKQRLSNRLLALGLALGALAGAAVLVAPRTEVRLLRRAATCPGVRPSHSERQRSARFSSTLGAARSTCSRKTAAE